MAKTIHIHLPTGTTITKTRDAGEFEESKHPRADNGQFGKGSGGAAPATKKPVAKGSSKPLHVQRQEKLDAEKAAKANPHLHSHLGSGDPKKTTKQDLQAHPMYSKADYTYLSDKGYSPDEIKALWDRDHKMGKKPEQVNKNSKQMQAHFAGIGKAMGIKPAPAKKPISAGSNGGSGVVINHQPSGTVIPHQSKPAPVRSPQYTPMRQAMRKQEAKGIREARHQTKVPQDPTRLKSVVREGAEATLQEVLARIRARKQ